MGTVAIREAWSVPHLYVIGRADGADPVKVGMSPSGRRRLGDLQVGNPHELVYLHVEEVACRALVPVVEAGVHAMVKGRHVRGEWYDLRDVAERAGGFGPLVVALITGCPGLQGPDLAADGRPWWRCPVAAAHRAWTAGVVDEQERDWLMAEARRVMAVAADTIPEPPSQGPPDARWWEAADVAPSRLAAFVGKRQRPGALG